MKVPREHSIRLNWALIVQTLYFSNTFGWVDAISAYNANLEVSRLVAFFH